MIQSRITSKAQTTIPAPVRKALGLREGDGGGRARCRFRGPGAR